MGEIKRIGIVYNKDKPDAKEMALKIKDWLRKQKGCKVFSEFSWSILRRKMDIVLVFGGDGRLLHAIDKVSKINREIFVVGINLGRVGYLCRINPNEAKARIKQILQGDFEIEPRTRIQAKIFRKFLCRDRLVKIIKASNEIVIGGIFKTVSLDLEINSNGKIIKDFVRGDGVIIATNIGKTGYNENANGITDGLDENKFVVTANNPVLHDRAISCLTRKKSVVFPAEAVFKIRSATKKRLNLPFVIGDGRLSCRLKKKDLVVVEKEPKSALFVKFKN